jgi:RND family efflux transporter MFP subunit
VINPKLENPEEELVLPCSLEAFEESPIYARTNGYLVRWYRDIGSHVNKGDLLAEIDTPELDQELHQAQAARQQILARMDLAKISAERWQSLVKSNSVSEQENDEQASGFRQAQASLADADANVRRLEQLEGFKKVQAPFSGVLTRRNVDPGALINAGAGATGRELFNLAKVDPLRIFSSVPQSYARTIRAGTRATITLQEYPGSTFVGVVARTSAAINAATRTLLTQVDLPNKDGLLLPGSFGEVHFSVTSGVNKVTVPVNTMLFRAEGSRVAVVGPDGKVALRAITIGRDYGTTLEVLSGLSTTDRVIINPADSLEEGQPVNIASTRTDHP